VPLVGRCKGIRTAAQRARITCCVDLPQRADVQVHVVARHGNSRRRRVYDTISFPVATGALPLRAIHFVRDFGATPQHYGFEDLPPGF